MEVYIVFQYDFECGGNYAGKVFSTEEKAKDYVDLKNEELHKDWTEYVDVEDQANWTDDFQTKEEYITHMIDQERYYYVVGEII